MKKKIFSLILSLCCAVSLFPGCNLFGTDYDRYYNEIVARSGDFTLTKEELLIGYYNYGQSLVSEQGYTVEDALEETMKTLLQRKRVVSYLKEEAAKEKANTSLKTTNYFYELTNAEYNAVVKQVWDYVDGKIKELVIKNYDNPDDVFATETKADPEFAGSRNEFVQTVELVDGKIKVVAEEKVDELTKLSVYDYQKPTFIQSDIVDEVFKQYVQSLREDEEYKKHTDNSDSAVFKRQLDKLFESYLDQAYIDKLEASYESTYGTVAELNAQGTPTGERYLSGATTQKILDKFTAMYYANKEEYEIDPTAFYKNVMDTSKRGSYVYFGESEAVIEVQHILVKFANDENSFVEDPQLSDEENKLAKENLNTVHNTYAKERDSEGYETGNTISVFELKNTLIKSIIDHANGFYTQGSQEYADYVTAEFGKLMYKYNEDGGILNAQFDYSIGSNGTSSMVEPFTNASIELYNLGYAGAISDIVESSYGYHIILYTNKLANIDIGALDLEMLSQIKLSTSTVEEDNMLEYVYGLVKNSAYSTYESNLIATLEAGQTYTYYKSVYKDLLK